MDKAKLRIIRLRCIRDALLVQGLRSGVSELAWAENCYNASWHSARKSTSFEVVYGRLWPSLLSYIPGMTRVDAVER